MELSRAHKLLLTFLVGFSSSTLYYPIYIKGIVYNPLREALGLTDVQIGALPAAFAWAALICYLPSGIIVDKIRVRTLFWTGCLGTAALTFAYSLLPSFGWLLAIHVGYGITTILIWWGVRFKLIRLFSSEEDYSSNVGISYGLYGVAGLIVSALAGFALNQAAGGGAMAIRLVLWTLTGLLLAVTIIAYLAIPKFEGEIAASDGAFDFSMVGVAFRNPVVLLCSLTMFFIYFFYTSVQYTTTYMEAIFGDTSPLVTTVGAIRQYGITLISGPIFGFIAMKIKSPSRVIALGCALFAAVMAVFIFLPTVPTMAMVIVGGIVLLGFLANGSFGIVSSQLSEGQVPLAIFGTATGILSVIGFLPDTFSGIWLGGIIQSARDSGDLLAAFPTVFSILVGAALLACLTAIALIVYMARNGLGLRRDGDKVAA